MFKVEAVVAATTRGLDVIDRDVEATVGVLHLLALLALLGFGMPPVVVVIGALGLGSPAGRAIGRESPRSLPLLATPTPHVNVVR